MAFDIVLALLVAAIIILLILLIRQFKITAKLNEALQQFTTDIKSQQVKYGKAWEKFAPFMKNFKYEPNDFKFIGEPIDGVVFGREKIVFLEIKAGGSKLSQRQKAIKEMVDKKRVEWEEIRNE